MDTVYCSAPEAALGVQGGEKPLRRILFVCTGNTCRSPMAAALYNDQNCPREVCSACAEERTPTGTVALSAGLYATPGAPISHDAIEALREAGVAPLPGNDYTAHRAQNVSKELIDCVDVVVAISAAHAMELMLRFPESAEKITTLPMDISDPYGRGSAAYRECLMQLRYCLHLMQNMGEA